MLKISHKRPECIGCGLCAEVAPNYWFMDEDGLATLHAISRDRGDFQEGDAFDEDEEILAEAERGCPVQIISVSS